MNWRQFLAEKRIELLEELSCELEWITLGENKITMHPVKAIREVGEQERDMIEDWIAVREEPEA